MSKTPDTTEAKPSPADVLKGALHVCREARKAAHSIEARHVLALEQIADELVAIRVHLTGAA